MKSEFRAYYPPSDEEMKSLWSDGLIVLDTNSLLNLFRYSAETRDELLALLKSEQSRVWIPHQVGLEFHRNRRSIAHDQEKAFDSVQAALDSAKTSIDTAIASMKRHPSREAEELSALLGKHMRKIEKGLRKARQRHTRAVLDESAHEQTLQEISEIYEGRVGEAFPEERLAEVLKIGVERYAKKIPPGFEDAKKRDERQYGDLLLWLQILDHASSEKRPMIFVTDDGKKDWWSSTAGKTHGPRPELVEEYYVASGERVHFYETRRFLAYAQKSGAAISDTSVEEAELVSTELDSARTLARHDSVQRMIDELNGHRITSARIRDITNGAVRPITGIVANDYRTGSPTFTDWLADENRIGIRQPAHFVTASDIIQGFGRPATQGWTGVMSEMLQRDEEMIDRLRVRNVVDESPDENARVATQDQDSDEPRRPSS